MTPFVCPHCKTPSEVDDRVTGGVVACPKCGQSLQLPTAPPPSIPASPTAGSVAIPDEDEATLRAELPDAFFAGTEALGRPRFQVERQQLRQDAYKPAFIAFLCCIPCVIGVFAGNWFARVLGVLFISGFVWGAVWLIRRERRKAAAYAVVWSDGFVHYDGTKYTVWRWADIAAVNMQSIDQRTLTLFIETSRLLTKYYRLRHRDGTEYQFWNTQGSRAAQFGYQVEQETFRLMWPDAVTRLNAGEPVTFGPFEVSANGIFYNRRFTPWEDIEPARLDQGHLVLDGLGPTTARVLLQKIDNHHVFLPLLKQKIGFA